ncbi:MAG: small multi-drug export protein [Armatimonadota bacterium]|nr:small multi-drug export protein [Armatimonadota bacterium]MDR7518393.1 small multi-drug export protein [Armatimonadota bacterium]MDR7549301.1 small multi-drug export protein [Armatimonadota bacterium]
MTDLGGLLEQARTWLVGLSVPVQALGVVGVTAVPGVELRGSIPLAVALGWHPLAAGILGTLANCLIIVPSYYALELFYDRWFSRIALLRRLVEGVRARGASLVERYKLLGLTLFVAVPLPGTGAYSGVTLAWLLGLRRWPAMAAVALGVVIAGAAVTLAAGGAAVAIRQWF